MDTSTYTHFCRAGHGDILERLAPSGIILIPSEVSFEIDKGRDLHEGIPAVASVSWAQVVVLNDDEVGSMVEVLAELGGEGRKHLGESAVIAYALHHGCCAVMDERAAIEQAALRGVETHDTAWIVIEAYKTLFGRDRDRTARVIDDLVATGMYLPVSSGESFLTWAWENELLP